VVRGAVAYPIGTSGSRSVGYVNGQVIGVNGGMVRESLEGAGHPSCAYAAGTTLEALLMRVHR
jgi:hypothetical protein